MLIIGVHSAFAIEHSVAGSVTTVLPSSVLHSVPLDGDKSQVVALLLAIFLGGWGIHLFYLGYKKQGLRRLLLTLLTYGIVIIGSIFYGLGAAAAASAAASGSSVGAGGLLIVLGIIFYIAAFVLGIYEFYLWIKDIIDIASGNLKPVNGKYTDTL